MSLYNSWIFLEVLVIYEKGTYVNFFLLFIWSYLCDIVESINKISIYYLTFLFDTYMVRQKICIFCIEKNKNSTLNTFKFLFMEQKTATIKNSKY